ncbi:MAG TPA: M56 family metallopeptidase [Phycisphaerae bacterium]|nr:M56 family metallopeptidase [Phycisphaerae bacterium]
MMELGPGSLADLLLSQSWQIAIVFGGVAVICWLSRRSSAHWRYLLWLIVLVKCLTPPIVRVPVGVLPSEGAALAVLSPAGERGGWVAAHAADFRFELRPGAPAFEGVQADAAMESSAQAGAQGVASHLSSGVVRDIGEQQVRRSLSVRAWLGVVWVIGTAALLLYAVLKAWRIHRRLKLSRQLADAAVQGEAEALCRRMGIRVPPAVYLVDGFSQPFVWGLLRGDVYLPSAVAADAGRRRKILAHELAHVARWDAAVNALQVLVQGLFFFHPLVWWANRQIRRERESCCDEAAIAVLAAPPQDYSRAIVDSLIHGRGQATPALSVAGPAKNVEARIRAIMRPNRIFRARPTPAAILTVSVLAVAALIVGLVPTRRAHAGDEVGTENVTAVDSSGGGQRHARWSGAGEHIPTARLSDDVTVSVLAVSRLDERPRRWWRPDGTPLAEPPYPGTERTDAKHQFELVFGLSDDVDGSESIGARCEHSSGLGKPKDAQGKPMDELRVVHIGFGDAAPDTTTARYALATGPWSRLATWQPHRADGSPTPALTCNEILFKPPSEEDGVTVLPFVHLPMGDATRMVAITRDGRTVTPFSTYVTGLVVSDTVCKFRVRLADIFRFEFSTRPYYIAEFRNVSLRRGKQTSVEVTNVHPDADLPAVERRQISRNVSDFPEEFDLSTPEAAYATINRVGAKGSSSNWRRVSVKELGETFRSDENQPVDPAWGKVLENARILEVWVWQGEVALVTAKLMPQFPSQLLTSPIDVRHLRLEDGEWRNEGNDRVDRPEQARREFQRMVGQWMVEHAEDHAADIRRSAVALFEKIRSADYEWFLEHYDAQSGRWWEDAWQKFPACGYYMVGGDWPSFVLWMCKSFHENPIAAIEVGQMFRGKQRILDRVGWPTVPYKLTLKDGTVLEGSLAFEFNFDGDMPHWHGMEGIDWHHMYPRGLTAERRSKELDLSTSAATAKALTQAVAQGDVAGALACFAADSHDLEDLRAILEGPKNNPMRQVFDAIDPTAAITITKQDVSDGRCEIAWQVTLKRAVTIKGTTLAKGEAFVLDGTLKKAGDSWLFVGL